MPRLHHLIVIVCGLFLTAVLTSAFAQDNKDKKDAPAADKKDDSKTPEVKKDDKKPDEPKKTEVKPDEPKKTEVKKEEPKKAEPAGLVWKFEVNKPFFQKMTTNTEQNIKVMGLDVTQKQDQTFYFKWTPIKQDGDKWEIKQEIEGIQMKIDIAGNPVSFDSTQENPPGGAQTGLAEFFKALKDSSFTITFNTKTMKVESVAGKEEFLKKLLTANQPLQPLLSKVLSEDALKQMADPTFGFLPPTAKKVDESWETTSLLNLGPIGSYTIKYKFTYKGEDPKNKDLDVINVDTTINYGAPTDSDPNLPFKIKSSTLTTKDKQAPGKILFNKKLGRLESWESKLILNGTLTIEIGGNTTNVELTQTQEISVKTDDKSLKPVPAEPKKTP